MGTGPTPSVARMKTTTATTRRMTLGPVMGDPPFGIYVPCLLQILRQLLPLAACCQVRVHRGSRDGRVAQRLLNVLEVGPVLAEPGGETVAQHVWVHWPVQHLVAETADRHEDRPRPQRLR